MKSELDITMSIFNILNHHLASLVADNDDGEADHSTTTLAANIELS